MRDTIIAFACGTWLGGRVSLLLARKIVMDRLSPATRANVKREIGR